MMNNKQWRGLGFLFLALAGLVLMLGVTLAVGWASDRPEYVVQVEGERFVVRGTYGTVGEVLAAAGVAVTGRDMVVPAVAAVADPELVIQVSRARRVVVHTAVGNSSHWTHQPNIAAFLDEIGLTPTLRDEIYADGVRLGAGQLRHTAVPSELEIGDFKTITILLIDPDTGDETRRVVRSSQRTVEAALAEADITLYSGDYIEPALDSWLADHMLIRLERSRPLTIEVDGRRMQIRSRHSQATAVLAEAGISLTPDDYTLPPNDIPLQTHDTIQVVRVTTDFRTVDSPLPYESSLQPTDQLEIDQRQVIQPGVPGILRQRIRQRYENGVLVSETADGEWVEQEPQDEIVGYGTNIVVRTLDTPEGPLEYWRVVKMRVTSYRPNTSGKPPDDPDYGLTASGVPAGIGVVAIDPEVVVFGSDLYVPNYGVAFAGDTGGGVKGRWIDLGYPDDMSVWVAWSGYVDVYHLTPIPRLERINFLLPEELP